MIQVASEPGWSMAMDRRSAQSPPGRGEAGLAVARTYVHIRIGPEQLVVGCGAAAALVDGPDDQRLRPRASAAANIGVVYCLPTPEIHSGRGETLGYTKAIAGRGSLRDQSDPVTTAFAMRSLGEGPAFDSTSVSRGVRH
jgi:hypothetical protein